MGRIIHLFCLALVLVSGCAVNPVTGRNELALISESQEIQIGQKNYLASRQMQGGDFSIDLELTKYVNGVGQRLAQVSDRKLPYEFVVLNNSTPNAWALPGGKIAINRGLLVELHNEAELAAVLGHEIVHAAARHGAKGMERGMLLQGAIVAAGIATQGRDFNKLAVGGAGVAAQLVQTKYSRSAELEADYYGMQYMERAGYDPHAAIGLQETFVRLFEKGNHNWLSGLFASHPPSMERVAANKNTALQLGKTGMLNRQGYLQKIDHLLETKEAYNYADKGREAYNKRNYPQAMQLGRKAIGLVPEEGHFHALVGDVYFQQRDYKKALEQYNEAVAQPGEFFYFYLQRGLAQEKLGNTTIASQDLEKSVRLLPTATAYNALGNFALALGDSGRAKQYFQEAASSDSEPGQESFRSLVRLDLPSNPGRYLSVSGVLEGQDTLIVKLGNKTPLRVGKIMIRILYPDSRGRMYETTRQVPGSIPSGKVSSFRMNFSHVTNAKMVKKISVQVVSAEVL